MSTAPPIAAPAPMSTKPRTRANWTPAQRAEWLALFERSGQSVTEFCRANDLPAATLSLWRQQQAAAGTVLEGGELAEIASSAFLAATRSKSLVTIRVPGAVAIEVSVGDRSQMARRAGEAPERRSTLTDVQHHQ